MKQLRSYSATKANKTLRTLIADHILLWYGESVVFSDGYDHTLPLFAEQLGINYQSMHNLVHRDYCAMNIDGTWKEHAKAVCAFLGVSPEDVFDLRSNDRRPAYSHKKPISYAKNVAAAEEEGLDHSDKGVFYTILNALNGKNTTLVIKLRFGLCGEKEHTLEQIGEILNLTRERIRMIEGKAMRHLRHPAFARRLKKML